MTKQTMNTYTNILTVYVKETPDNPAPQVTTTDVRDHNIYDDGTKVDTIRVAVVGEAFFNMVDR